ncbi:unnamed protein product [Prunus armeniaca]|uniref:RNA helicase n=1 Tax=Prunus armeniaca TaxID=36596 RepID=A0A6J5VQH2_PRUAR|nr:unnamed protein product [Prunus armeniaca]
MWENHTDTSISTQGQKEKIGITLTRGIATVMPSVTARVACENRGPAWILAYSSPDNKTDHTSNVLIKYKTDGILVREILDGEADLEGYGVVMVDEANERTLSTDILLGKLKDIALSRQCDFKLLISCSTETDAKKLSGYFDSAPVFKIPRRRLRNLISHMKKMEEGLVNQAVARTLEIHVTQSRLTQQPGDILVFLPVQQEIEGVDQMLRQLTKACGHGQLIICPIIHAQALEPTPQGAGKVVLATSVAETSLLILTGIHYVIDSGFCIMKSYHPTAGVESALLSPISKALAVQRAEQAGSMCAM